MTIQSKLFSTLFGRFQLAEKIEKFSIAFRSINRFNLANFFLLSGFIAPLVYFASTSSADQNSLATCNPYIASGSESSSELCTDSNTLDPKQIQKGIDVSHYQGNVLWEKVASNNLTFAITKATGGESYTDPSFTRNWYEIRRNELIRGAYHFFYAGDDPENQAQHFLDTVGKFRKNDLPPILDIEITDQVSTETLKQRALTWLETVEDKTDRRPIIYTDPAFANQFLNDARFAQYYLWLADYSEENPETPSPWKNKQWFLLQYTENGQVDGITGNVDLNHYRGSVDNFKTFIQLTNL